MTNPASALTGVESLGLSATRSDLPHFGVPFEVAFAGFPEHIQTVPANVLAALGNARKDYEAITGAAEAVADAFGAVDKDRGLSEAGRTAARAALAEKVFNQYLGAANGLEVGERLAGERTFTVKRDALQAAQAEYGEQALEIRAYLASLSEAERRTKVEMALAKQDRSVMFALVTAPTVYGFDPDLREQATSALVGLMAPDDVAITETLVAALALPRGAQRELARWLRDQVALLA